MTPKGAFPPAIFAGFGSKLNDMRWGVGAGLNIPGGGFVFWPDNWPGRNEIISGPGGWQILVDDPSGNPIELFQPAE